MVGAVMTMMRKKKARAKAMKKKPPKMKVVPNPNQLLPALLSLLKKGSSEIKDEIDSLSSTCDSNEGVKEMAYPGDDEFKTTEWIDRYDDRHPFDDTLNIDLDNDLVGVSVDHQLGKNMNTLEMKVSIWRTGITPLS